MTSDVDIAIEYGVRQVREALRESKPDDLEQKSLEELAMLHKILHSSFYARFKLAIVTALPKEYAAVRRASVSCSPIFHYISEAQYLSLRFDAMASRTNSSRDVILVKAPQMGNSSSAIASISTLKDFPSIQDLLMVGIAGGIPNLNNPQKDVRLGDIVVSAGKGLIQYDLTKIEDDNITIRCLAPKPSKRLCEVVDKLEADRIYDGSSPWEAYIEQCSQIENGKRPGQEADKFSGRRNYRDEADPRRKRDMPVVHYGIIGSANSLVKKEELRDELGDRHGVLAVEMEGSGLADASWFEGKGYLIIRGVCDYCDMDKNDAWQGYAAACAAAYTRALIEAIPSL